ncbi:MAG: lysophospholipid acyltransferase family protein [Rhodoblastus sp.]
MAALRLVATGILIALALALVVALSFFPARIALRGMQGAQIRLCRWTCKALGLVVEADGRLPEGGPVLLVANHISWTDVIVLGALSPLVFVARHDLASWLALGRLARAFGALFVERGRRRLIPHVNRQMAARMGNCEVVALFPEATTGDGTRLRAFNASHFAAARDLLRERAEIANVLIAPVALAYTRRWGLPLGRAGRARLAWYGDTTFAPHLLDLARSGPVLCKVRFLRPISFDRADDRKTVARRAAEAIRTAFVGDVMDVCPLDASTYVLSRRQVV